MGRECKKTNDPKTIRPRDFVEMRASLTAAESDVLDIIFYMMDLKPDEDTDMNYIIDAHDYVGLFVNSKGAEMSAKRIYDKITNGVNGLYKLDLRFTQNTDTVKKGIAFRAVASQGWNSGNYRVKVELTPMFKKIMVEQKKLNDGYALYELKNQFALSGTYAKRLYPMLMRFHSTGVRFDNADELRTKLGVPASCRQHEYLKIIEKAVDEINGLPNIHVTLETKEHSVSGGRRIDSFVFKISEQISDIQKECEEHVENLFDKLLNPGDAKRIAETAGYDISRIDKIKEIFDSYTDEIRDATAFIMSALKDEWKAGQSRKEGKKENTNKFNNFSQRSYDFAELEKQLLNQHRKED